MTVRKAEVVPKKWGHELIIENNDKYCGKVLHFEDKCKFSMHFHMLKHETWYVQSGRFIYRWIDTTNADQHEKEIGPGDVIVIEPGHPHQLEALERGDIFEVSTKHYDSDSYRVWKGDSQNK
jgi:mannose-6-phosphate isomerase-like protein (cupin superfamily)